MSGSNSGWLPDHLKVLGFDRLQRYVPPMEPYRTQPGTFCPDCGEVTRQRPKEDPQGEWHRVPHADPRECVRYLRNQLKILTEEYRNHNHASPGW